jgi:hypothetical protein
MITTNNVEYDAAFAELLRQLGNLSSECAAKAGRIAVLEERLKQGVSQSNNQHDSDHRDGQVNGEQK